MQESIVSLFEDNALRHSERVALVIENEVFTYGQLNSVANRLAFSLGASVKKGSKVAFCFSDNPSSILITILAVLKQGGIYIPIDPRNPKDRLFYLLDSAKPDLVIGNTETSSLFAESNNFINFDTIDLDSENNSANSTTELQSFDPAYIIFTSGSTGRPKGVMVSHGNLIGVYHA
jgi:non-ribosomal peptide synthetase component F